MVNKPVFYEEGHKYINPVTGELYTSVTTLLHQYVPEKNWQEIAERYVAKRSENKLIEELLGKYVISKDSLLESFDVIGKVATVRLLWEQENKKSCDQGTKYHKGKETLDRNEHFHTIDGRRLEVKEAPVDIENLYLLEDGVYLELLVWNNGLVIAGQADKIIIYTENDIRYVIIEDYKTNKEIINYNYIDKRTQRPIVNEYLQAPVNHLCNCNYNLYQLQLNLYGWLLVQFGFKIKRGKIIHVTDNDKIYPLNNHQNDIEAIIAHFKDAKRDYKEFSH